VGLCQDPTLAQVRPLCSLTYPENLVRRRRRRGKTRAVQFCEKQVTFCADILGMLGLYSEIMWPRVIPYQPSDSSLGLVAAYLSCKPLQASALMHRPLWGSPV
jgi:hypothetical protein